MHVDVIIFSHTSCWFCYTIILAWDSCEVSRAGENSFFSMQGHLCGVVQKRSKIIFEVSCISSYILLHVHVYFLLMLPTCISKSPFSLSRPDSPSIFTRKVTYVGFKPTFCLWTILVICFIFMFLVFICLKFWNYSTVICQAYVSYKVLHIVIKSLVIF